MLFSASTKLGKAEYILRQYIAGDRSESTLNYVNRVEDKVQTYADYLRDQGVDLRLVLCGQHMVYKEGSYKKLSSHVVQMLQAQGVSVTKDIKIIDDKPENIATEDMPYFTQVPPAEFRDNCLNPNPFPYATFISEQYVSDDPAKLTTYRAVITPRVAERIIHMCQLKCPPDDVFTQMLRAK